MKVSNSKAPGPTRAQLPALRARRRWAPLLTFLLALSPFFAGAQTVDIHDAVRTYSTLSNTTVTLSGRAELRITGTGDPIPGCLIQLNSPDGWLLMTGVLPS